MIFFSISECLNTKKILLELTHYSLWQLLNSFLRFFVSFSSVQKIDGVLTFDQELDYTSQAVGSFFMPSFFLYISTAASDQKVAQMTLFSYPSLLLFLFNRLTLSRLQYIPRFLKHSLMHVLKPLFKSRQIK